MQLTPHFWLREFTESSTARDLGIDNSPSPTHLANLKQLAQTLEQVRALLGHPVFISPGYRSPKLNAALANSSSTSDHMNGLAADISCPGYGTNLEVAQTLAASDIKFDQLIYEQGQHTTWVHLGIGSRMRQEVLSWKSGKGYVRGVRKL